MGCSKVGSGVYAGNSACGCGDLEEKARKITGDPAAKVEYSDGTPYATTNLNFSHKMPIPILSAVGGISQALTGAKVQQAEQGQVFTKPKTLGGKVVGLFSGRTKAAEISENMQAQSQAGLDAATSKNLARQGIPVSGGVSFGQATQNETLKILGLVGGVIIAIFYFNRKKGRRGRR